MAYNSALYGALQTGKRSWEIQRIVCAQTSTNGKVNTEQYAYVICETYSSANYTCIAGLKPKCDLSRKRFNGPQSHFMSS